MNVSSQGFFAYKKGSFCPVSKKLPAEGNVFSAGRIQISLASATLALILLFCACGALYLFQVNSIATKGFEVRELEGKIEDLKKEGRKMEIREVELRSMYNIEKASKDLELVESKEVTYVEINGPMAMK